MAQLMPISIYALVLIAWSGSVAAVISDRTYFTNPPSSDSDADDMPSYELGSVQELSWTTDLDVFNISIWQRGREDENIGLNASGGNIFSQTNPSNPITTISWAVQPYAFDLNTSSIFYLAIESAPNKWASTNFNITQSSSNRSSSSPSQFPETNYTDSDPSSTSEASSTSLTSTGKIALGLGVGIGAPLISLLAILAYFQYRSARRAYTHTHHPNPHTHPHPHSYSQPPPMGYPSPSTAVEQVPFSVPTPAPVPLYRNLSPSELPQKLAEPLHLQPWEVHSQCAAPVPLGLEVGSRSDRETINGRVSKSGTRSTSVRASRGLGIPELPGESYNFI
ncbi:hypothetical protein BDW62DRAFT_198833 [Aspergillus aurantiobrunneus]